METPKTKTAWKKVLERFSLKMWKGSDGSGWLSDLPISIPEIKPVPLVIVENTQVSKLKQRLLEHKLTLQWSTMFLLEGYNYPKGYSVFALTRPGDSWWEAHSNGNCKRITE